MKGMVAITVVSAAANFVFDRFLLGLPLFGAALLSLIVMSFGSLFCACLWKVLAPIRAARDKVEASLESRKVCDGVELVCRRPSGEDRR